MYRNNRYHENTHQQVARYKMEALDRRYDEIWDKDNRLIERLHTFQSKHFENRQQTGNLNYESKRCWVNLAEKYIKEASSPIRSEIYTLSELGFGRSAEYVSSAVASRSAKADRCKDGWKDARKIK
jgi:hypothetical protein